MNLGRMGICRCPSAVVLVTGLLLSTVVLSTMARADVERYKTEAGYLGRLAELGYDVVFEGFESSAWDGARSPTINDRHSPPSVTSQQLTWEPAAKDVWGSSYSNRTHGVTTNHNWARSGEWGIYEDHNGDIVGYPTTIRISSVVPVFAVGGWFDTNPDGQSVGFLFEDRTTANPPGYVLPGIGAMYPGDNPSYGHEFVGIVDPAGFTSVVLSGTLQVNEEGMLEGGNIFGADDFTFGVPVGFLPTPGDSNADGHVDGQDYLNWAAHYGDDPALDPPGAPTNGDYNHDGVVHGLDYLIWAGNYGQGPNDTVAVPEPTSFALLLVGSMVSVGCIVRRSRKG